MDSLAEFTDWLNWLKLDQTGLSSLVKKFTDLEKTHGSENSKISMIVANIILQYPYEIKAN